MLVQISSRSGHVRRVPYGHEPRIDLELEPGEYIVRLDVRDNRYQNGDRRTYDAWWTVWVAAPQGDG